MARTGPAARQAASWCPVRKAALPWASRAALEPKASGVRRATGGRREIRACVDSVAKPATPARVASADIVEFDGPLSVVSFVDQSYYPQPK